MLSASTFEQEVAGIERSVRWIRDAALSADGRADRAAAAGAEFAAAVYRFTEDPGGVGLDALREEYGRFMGQHSANFTQSAWDATHPAAVAA